MKNIHQVFGSSVNSKGITDDEPISFKVLNKLGKIISSTVMPENFQCTHKAYGKFPCHFLKGDRDYCKTHEFLTK